MKTVEIAGQVRTTPQFCRKHSTYTFSVEYEPKRMSEAVARARPPIPTLMEFTVV